MSIFTKEIKPFAPSKRAKNCQTMLAIYVNPTFAGDAMIVTAHFGSEVVRLGEITAITEVEGLIRQAFESCCGHCFRRLRECEIGECSDCKQEYAIYQQGQKK